MKMQVENSLNYMSSYQKTSESPHEQYNLALSRTQQPFQPLSGLASPSKTMGNINNLSSFDASGMQIHQNSQEASQNLYWSNGIAYSGDKINKEKIRRKSDMFLIRLANSILYKISNLPPEDISWCEELTKDLVLLSQYISKVYSRISIFQIIDTVMNPLVAIKKILSDIIMKDKRSFNTGTGLIQSPFLNVESWRGTSNAQKSPNFSRFKENSNNKRIEIQYEKAVREVIAYYLDTLSAIFNRCKTQETFKMFCEVFIKDRNWQDTVQAYTMFLFKVDLLSETQKKAIQATGKQTLISIDENILNRDTVIMGLSSDERRSTDIEKNINIITSNMKEVSNQARSAIHYYEAINVFINRAIVDAKERTSLSEKSTSASHFADVVAEVGQEFEEDDEEENDNYNQTHSLEPEKEDPHKTAQNKILNYWHKVQKRVLYTYAFLIAPANGVLLQYLDHHGTNYSVTESKDVQISTCTLEESEVPIRFILTTTILKFCETLFTCADKSLYNQIFTDELVLSFIRMHWICFIRLYNRSFRSVHETQEAEAEYHNQLRESYNSDSYPYSSEDTNFTSKSINAKIALLTMCKLHLKCVCVMANNRSEIIRKNLYQFKILDFCVREIDLEYEESAEKEELGKLTQG